MKVTDILNELRAEFISGGDKVLINDKIYDINKLTGFTKKVIDEVVKRLGRNITHFTKYDLKNWDIKVMGDGKVIVTDDEGKVWNLKSNAIR